ncbi:MAG TPA: hypothetical protein VH088_15970 [Terriglobales bacterium]|nr:hypothetical protein [Terriglobales bacterium]
MRAPSPTARDLLAIFFRQRRLVLVSFFGIFLVITLYGIFLPSYQSHMKVLVRRGRVDPSTSPMVPQAAPFDRSEISEEDLNSEVELLRDQEILRTVMDDAGLAARKSWFNFSNEASRRERGMHRLAERLEVKPVRKTSLIEISYTSANAVESAWVLRCLARAYLQRHVRVQQPSGEFDFFEQQASRAERGLEQAQTELVNFTHNEGVVSASLERDNALQRLNEAEDSSRQVEIQISETAQRFRTLQQQLLTLPERTTRQQRTADNAELLEKFKSRLLELQLKRTELLTKFEPTYRLVLEVDAQIMEAKQSLANEQQFPLRDQTTDQNPDHEWAAADLLKTRVDLSSLHSRATATRQAVANDRQVADQLGKRALQQDVLLRNLKTAEAAYLLYINKREEARIGDALDQNGILNVSLAEQPSVPALPTRSALGFGAVGLFVGGLFSTTAAFVADRLDPSFRTCDEVVAYLSTPVLASLPQRND